MGTDDLSLWARTLARILSLRGSLPRADALRILADFNLSTSDARTVVAFGVERGWLVLAENYVGSNRVKRAP